MIDTVRESSSGKGEVERLFTAIAHGDPVHRAWLWEALDAFYRGQSVPEPRSQAPTPDRARVEVLEEALEEMRSRRQHVITSYERNGPTWTSEQGSELYDANYVTDSAREDVELIETALAHTTAVSGGGTAREERACS